MTTDRGPSCADDLMAGMPWLKFFPADWLADAALSACSLAAQGCWMRMVCLMYQCDERGVLATAGKAWADEKIARACGGDQGMTLSCISELVDAGVAHRNTFGAVYCRRMVRDEQTRKLCSDAGRRGGGNPTLRGIKVDPKVVPNPPPKVSLASDLCSSAPLSLVGGAGGERGPPEFAEKLLALRQAGVTDAVAAQLAALPLLPLAECRRRIECQQTAGMDVGWIVSAIRGGWPYPRGWKSADDIGPGERILMEICAEQRRKAALEPELP